MPLHKKETQVVGLFIKPPEKNSYITCTAITLTLQGMLAHLSLKAFNAYINRES